MTKRWAGLMGLRAGSVARAEDLLTACVRECARHVAASEDRPGPEQRRLVAAVGELVVRHTDLRPSEDDCFESLLEVGRRALDAGEVRLARRLADSAVALRSRSAEAWHLRGRALERLGRAGEAEQAFTRSRGIESRTARPAAV
ncbi:tetratricopeptide repeat protein [Streptomyces alkaliphilus]|uniref:Tetratricopeptide repeat protein n=1 Tax=Streptomyces alkaliphilus TaxID=1472722 RepID=A0A7W3THT3_9ACTN|nr:tetratricopeptide repeat protein [Streptomyces alkaliphilus]MBB0247037.1 tetratricopeptide repeat protein [Streptomyces alkaliphilus]MQS09261.1 tetratricopeptide repeat protein [Streptomyces alkaliphilus]